MTEHCDVLVVGVEQLQHCWRTVLAYSRVGCEQWHSVITPHKPSQSHD
jgi:hypothetical protein